MPYLNRSHGISEGLGTQRHLYGLLTRYLNENLPAGGRRRGDVETRRWGDAGDGEMGRWGDGEMGR